MNNIFISYRRDDSKDVSGRIHDHLVSSFTKKYIFKDVDSIPVGVDFREFIVDSVRSCEVMLVIIGRKWVNITNDSGKRRIECEDDYVRIEIETAIEYKIPIFPVLVSDAKLPSLEELPDSIKDIHYNNAISIRPDPDFKNDIYKLVKSLKGLAPHKRRRNIKIITVFLSILMVTILYVYIIPSSTSTSPGTPGPSTPGFTLIASAPTNEFSTLEQPLSKPISTPTPISTPKITKLLSYYIENTNGTITDKPRGLMWERCSAGQENEENSCKGEAEIYSWYEASSLISEKKSYNDWRLPTREELKKFISVNSGNNVINTLFPNSSDSYWTSEETYMGSESAYVLNLVTKVDLGAEKYEKKNIRLVRRTK